MTWHKWTDTNEDGSEVEIYVYVPDDPIQELTYSEDWPEVFCGPEYWMWRHERRLEEEFERKLIDDEDG